MSVIAMTIRCDRDNKEVSAAMEGVMLPEGWTHINFGGASIMPMSGHLCPECSDAFVTFMQTTGGTFMFKKFPKPPQSFEGSSDSPPDTNRS